MSWNHRILWKIVSCFWWWQVWGVLSNVGIGCETFMVGSASHCQGQSSYYVLGKYHLSSHSSPLVLPFTINNHLRFLFCYSNILWFSFWDQTMLTTEKPFSNQQSSVTFSENTTIIQSILKEFVKIGQNGSQLWILNIVWAKMNQT